MALLLLAIGCGPQPYYGDAGSEYDPDAWAWTDAGPRADAEFCEEVVDLVFVLDTSSSMGFVLDQLESQMPSVVDASNALATGAHFGLIVFQDNHWLDTTGPLEGGVVHDAAATLQTAFAYYRDNYTDHNRNPGDGISGPTMQNPICEENSLDALYAAATDFPWRETATRVIILVTDDTFLERPDNYGDRDGDGDTTSTDMPAEGDYPALRTLAETTAALREQRVRVFSFTRLTVPGMFDLTKCGTGRRLPWEDITHGWSQPYNGQDPIPVRTDAANFDVDLVKDGSLSLSETINSVVLDSHCAPPIL